MANYCSLLNHRKFQTLKNMSGLSDSIILDRMDLFADLYGRFPELDELPGANSLPHLKKEIQMKESSRGTTYATTDKILAATNASSILEANAVLNNEHKDLDIQLDSIGNTTLIKVKKRPTEYDVLETSYETNIPKDLSLQKVGLKNALDKMREYYGIDIAYIDSDDVLDNVDVNMAKAFIKDGTIYINTDNATIDSPIHEMLHMFMGSISFSDPALFLNLLETMLQIPNIEERLKLFEGTRTLSDSLEEIFVEELAKYLTNLKSIIDTLPRDIKSTILYNIKRDIDTIIDGNYSVKSLDLDLIFNKSLRELAEELESSSFNIDLAAGLNNAAVHRILANTKSDLMKSGDLQELCG